ncbi:uncharacterized protein LOC100373305 [Saccoglossus kowalevskii]|uniref:Uncharacterized protein LOC100373305 n=1 Tax=Saccoglossus kowalevskii TaxID=10224 RepID=A0ABM0GKC7_SACKO|nr:PREDICTED: uncharacterized protein LOC100373305 [Saccoglossus kowalevskii]
MKLTDVAFILIVFKLSVSWCTAANDCDTTVTEANDCILEDADFPNGDFEMGDKYWEQIAPLGYEISTDSAYTGDQSMKVDMTYPLRGGATTTIYFDHDNEPNRVSLRACSKAVDVSTGGDSSERYCLSCHTTNTLGVIEGPFLANFTVGTHDWEEKELSIKSKGDHCISKLVCECLVMFRTGTIYFDSITMKQGNCKGEV